MEHGCRGSESARLHLSGLDSIPAQPVSDIWVDFVVGSNVAVIYLIYVYLLCTFFCADTSGFPTFLSWWN